MFGISKREIVKRYKDKTISDLREKGVVTFAGIGSLYWDGKADEVNFTADPSLIRVLRQRS